MNTVKATKKKSKFAIFSVIQCLFKSEPSELEKLLLMFLKGDGYKKLAEEQGKAMQEHNYRLKEVERQRMIKEKYDYLKYRIEEGLSVSDEQQKEYDYVRFLCERK
jgi:hypothetical protein